MKHVLEAQQFHRELIQEIFALADTLEKKTDDCLKGKIMASLFYEPSTRTRFSFESAMLRLGGNVISTENAREFSSAVKGETLEDSIRVVSNYADIIVLRHFEVGASKRAAEVASIPVINAGDGAGQHPTQALLDLYTIKRELNKIDGVRIAMIGDLKHGRTVRSLAYLLSKYEDIKIYFISPKELSMAEDVKEYLTKQRVAFTEHEDLNAALSDVDVLYQTRIQKERFENAADYEGFKGIYQIDKKVVGRMKPHAIIMHPLPRVDEILPEVDKSPQAVYFKQTYYGLLVRMALLKLLLTKS